MRIWLFKVREAKQIMKTFGRIMINKMMQFVPRPI